jgi:hypothetical protein
VAGGLFDTLVLACARHEDVSSYEEVKTVVAEGD